MPSPRSLATLVVTLFVTTAAVATAASATQPTKSARAATFVGRPSSMCPRPASGPQYEGPSVRGGQRTIALTFDDGPGRSTQSIINILEAFHVRATFFNVGTGEVSWPSITVEEARDGFLLGDHTVDHPDLELLSASTQAYEMDGVINEQRLLTASSPCVFRPPYGAWNATTLSLANSRGMSLWMWNNSGDDWEARGSGSTAWVQRIQSLVEGEGINQLHAVVLLHNQRIFMPATVAALPGIISFFQRHNYAFVDLLGRTGPPGTCATTPATTPGVAGTYLDAGSTLGSGASVSAPAGQFTLTMRADGNLVQHLATGRVLWTSNTSGHPGATLRVDPSGKVVIETPSSEVVWSSGTAGHPGARLAVRADGTVVVSAGRTALWRSGPPTSSMAIGERLLASWRLTSPNGLCRLIQQPSGPLTLLGADGQVLWSTGTSHATGAFTVLQRDGNLGVFSSTFKALWQSVTGGYRRAHVALTDAGQLVISSGSARVWVTP